MNPDIFSNYFGPKAENADLLKKLLNQVIDSQSEWRAGCHPEDPSLFPSIPALPDNLIKELNALLERSKQNIPFFHPRYSAQMTKDPTLTAIAGYLTFMLSNPNNHAYEGGPVTTEMEMETTDMLLKMCGYQEGWGHLASGGSLANTEALWAIRDHYKNDDAILFSSVCHYSWKRICSILRIDNFREVPADGNFHIDLNYVEDFAKKNKTKAVIANLGSTGTGSIDDIESLIHLKERFGFHLHIDAAYGGFFRSTILGETDQLLPWAQTPVPNEYTYRQLIAVEKSDSITIDPHKQGLISYGAGAVLYKNEALRNVVLNYAPYTYHMTDKPNIGMWSFEGSRPGAIAAACYLTYKVYPLNMTGVGKILSYSFATAAKFYELISESKFYEPLNNPDLDISCFYPVASTNDIASLNEKALKVYHQYSLEAKEPEYILSKFVMPVELAKQALPEYINYNNELVTVMRSVFMKHWNALDDFRYVRELVKSLEAFASSALL